MAPRKRQRRFAVTELQVLESLDGWYDKIDEEHKTWLLNLIQSWLDSKWAHIRKQSTTAQRKGRPTNKTKPGRGKAANSQQQQQPVNKKPTGRESKGTTASRSRDNKRKIEELCPENPGDGGSEDASDVESSKQRTEDDVDSDVADEIPDGEEEIEHDDSGAGQADRDDTEERDRLESDAPSGSKASSIQRETRDRSEGEIGTTASNQYEHLFDRDGGDDGEDEDGGDDRDNGQDGVNGDDGGNGDDGTLVGSLEDETVLQGKHDSTRGNDLSYGNGDETTLVEQEHTPRTPSPSKVSSARMLLDFSRRLALHQAESDSMPRNLAGHNGISGISNPSPTNPPSPAKATQSQSLIPPAETVLTLKRSHYENDKRRLRLQIISATPLKLMRHCIDKPFLNSVLGSMQSQAWYPDLSPLAQETALRFVAHLFAPATYWKLHEDMKAVISRSNGLCAVDPSLLPSAGDYGNGPDGLEMKRSLPAALQGLIKSWNANTRSQVEKASIEVKRMMDTIREKDCFMYWIRTFIAWAPSHAITVLEGISGHDDGNEDTVGDNNGDRARNNQALRKFFEAEFDRRQQELGLKSRDNETGRTDSILKKLIAPFLGFGVPMPGGSQERPRNHADAIYEQKELELARKKEQKRFDKAWNNTMVRGKTAYAIDRHLGQGAFLILQKNLSTILGTSNLIKILHFLAAIEIPSHPTTTTNLNSSSSSPGSSSPSPPAAQNKKCSLLDLLAPIFSRLDEIYLKRILTYQPLFKKDLHPFLRITQQDEFIQECERRKDGLLGLLSEKWTAGAVDINDDDESDKALSSVGGSVVGIDDRVSELFPGRNEAMGEVPETPEARKNEGAQFSPELGTTPKMRRAM